MYDNVTMKTKRDVRYGSDYKLNIVISEGNGKHFMKKPMKIDLKRLVLSSPMLITLIYAVRPTIKPSFKLNIHHQCLDVNLVSPTYITDDELECHRPPDYKVCAGNAMRFGFISGMLDNVSYGVLIYKLQRKQKHESAEISKDTSSAACLLVVWRIFEYKELCADALLIRHDK
jgi:hypothetical protein